MDYVLFETAPGYALFKVLEAENIGSMIESMQESMQNYESFAKVVALTAFLPFHTAEQMLDNMNALSEGLLTDDLKSFITTYVPRDSTLGVVEDKLASAIAEACEIQCSKTKLVAELHRGIRLHFTKFIEGMKADDLDKAQRSLGHSYSGSKVKFNVNKSDNMVIQSICLLDQLDKDVNTLAMRAREWYSWHFPELVTIVPDNYTYARCVMTIGKKEDIMTDPEGTAERLREVLGEDAEDVVSQIIEASKTSMGYEISDFDLECVMHFAERVVKLTEYKRDLQAYLVKKMKLIAPNLSSLIGETIGARLISHAGSLTNLAKYPASTVQILGAEKALFRALKSRGKTPAKTPKYGLIFNSTFIGRASTKNKGRISRYLANKASIASRIDCFSEGEAVGDKFGEMLRQQVEERLDFYESGKVPRKNTDCMEQVQKEIDEEEAALAAKKDKKKKKKHHHHHKEEESAAAAAEEEQPAMEVEEESKKDKKKKKAKKRDREEVENVEEATPAVEEEAAEEPAPKKKKHHHKSKN